MKAKSKDKIFLRAFKKFGELEVETEPIFGKNGHRVFEYLSSSDEDGYMDNPIDFEKLSDEELSEWIDGISDYFSVMIQTGCFYGEELFEDGRKQLGSLRDGLSRFRGSSMHRMF